MPSFSILRTGLLLLGTLLLLSGLTGCSDPVSDDPDFIPGELLVTLTDPLETAQVRELTDEYEIELLEYFEYVHIVWVGVTPFTEEQWIETLEADDRVKRANKVRGNVTLRD